MTVVEAEDVSRPAQRSRRVLLAVGAASFLCALVWLGYRLVYAQFQSYDDEGYLLITVRQFLDGAPLYDSVYTQYGPAYYLWQQILHGVLGVPLTHDATRLVTLVVWLACAILAALPVWLLTRRRVLTAIALTFAFIHLTPLTLEPGHPQELCLLSVLGVVVIALWRTIAHGRIGMAPAAAIGVLLAVASLTKMNVGAFLVLGLTLAVVMSARGFLARHVVLRNGIITLLMLAALIPLRNHLLRGDVVAFVIIVWAGLVALVVADRDDSTWSGIITFPDVVACIAGVVVGAAVIVGATVQRGTSLDALYDGLFVSPLHFPTDLFWTRVPVSGTAALLSLFWPVAAVCVRRRQLSVDRWLPYVQITMARLVCLLSMANWFNPLLAIAPPFASSLLAPSSLDGRQRVARRTLAFTAILMVLQVYPMPGTQVSLGTLLLLPIALVLIPEAEQQLKRAPTGSRKSLFGVEMPSLVMIVALGILAAVRIQNGLSAGVAMQMPGAENVRSREADVAAYHWLTANLRRNCDGFISAPGFNSLHFWTGIPPVTSLNTTVWPVLFDVVQQEQILRATASVDRLCAVRSGPAMRHLLSGPGIASRPLARFMARGLEPQATFGEWEFLTRRGQKAVLVNQGQWIEQGGLAIELAALGDKRLERLEVLDLERSKILADSAAKDVGVYDESNVPLQSHGDRALSRPRRLIVRGGGLSTSTGQTIVVRIWGSDDQIVERVPVVTTTHSLQIQR